VFSSVSVRLPRYLLGSLNAGFICPSEHVRVGNSHAVYGTRYCPSSTIINCVV